MRHHTKRHHQTYGLTLAKQQLVVEKETELFDVIHERRHLDKGRMTGRGVTGKGLA